jgi:hypothetical protein
MPDVSLASPHAQPSAIFLFVYKWGEAYQQVEVQYPVFQVPVYFLVV